MACFADINVSQGSVATYARCGGICYIHLTTNLLRNLPVKNGLNRLWFDRIMVMRLWPSSFDHRVQCWLMSQSLAAGQLPARICKEGKR